MERRRTIAEQGIVDEEGNSVPIAPRRRRKKLSKRTSMDAEDEDKLVLNPENCDHCAYLVYLKDRAAARVRERENSSD